MITNMTSASYDPTTGQINVVVPNTSINGYSNTISLYQTPNTISVPAAGNLIDVDFQCATQMQMVGIQSSIIDENYTIAPGEFSSYSSNWYVSTRNSGVEIQEANTSNKENQMMGQSTNQILSDILGFIIQIVTYLTTHTHTGVLTGGGTSGPPNPPPSDSVISEDKTYIDGNKNLAITGTYEPK